MPNFPRGECLTDVQVAAESGVSVRTIRNWRMNGKGPAHYRLGSRVVYRRSDVEAWLEAHRIETRDSRARSAA